MRNTLLLAGVAFYGIACASSAPLPKVAPAPPVAAAPRVPFDADEFRKELENAYTQILSRDTADPGELPHDAPVVDVEAAASIPIPEHRTIDSAVRLFSEDMKDSIQTSLLRSARYRKLIDKALDEKKLPKGLAYLPVIESAYMPTLTSRAGAHGIWQFMPDTAREYGLRVDWWVDERADPEHSTRAAATYLRDLYRDVRRLVAGPGRLQLRPGPHPPHARRDRRTTFWELLDAGLLPKETRGYVPTFYATLLIASDPDTYGFRLGEIMDARRAARRRRGPVSLRLHRRGHRRRRRRAPGAESRVAPRRGPARPGLVARSVEVGRDAGWPAPPRCATTTPT